MINKFNIYILKHLSAFLYGICKNKAAPYTADPSFCPTTRKIFLETTPRYR